MCGYGSDNKIVKKIFEANPGKHSADSPQKTAVLAI